jgi:hypothetical protein
MSNRLAIGMLAVTVLGSSGCMLFVRSVQNVCDEFANSLDECKEAREYRNWAKANWEWIKRSPCGAVYSEDYACGFQDGFVAYVWRGGSGEPPPLPPPRYRTAHYRTPEGYRAIEQWFAGWRHGATVAQEQGYRRLVTGPCSLPPPPAPGPAGPPPPPRPVPQQLPAPAAVPPREELPPPRTAPAPPADEALPPPQAEPAAANLATVPFEVQPDTEDGAESEGPPADRNVCPTADRNVCPTAPPDLVPVPFEVQPASDGGAETDHSTDNPEG